jgi:hypothetical protein
VFQLEPSKAATLRAIYAWREFTPDWARSIVDYLLEHAGAGMRELRSRTAIHAKLFSTEPLESCNIPMKITRINDKLVRFFEGPGSSLEWRVFINTAPRGKTGKDDHYEVVFEMAGEDALRRFWEPHLAPNVPTRFIYGEPLFAHQPGASVYTRDVGKNQPHKLEHEDWKSYTFITLGDLRFLWDVSHWLLARGVGVESNGFRNGTLFEHLQARQKVRHENLVVLGTPRSNGIIQEYQKDYPFPFVIDEDAIRRTDTAKVLRDGEISSKQDSQCAYAVVSRRPGIQIGAVTVVASNNGRAIQGVGELLTSGVLLTELIAREPKLAFLRTPLPGSFQILLEFELTDFGTFVRSYHVIDVWKPRSRQRRSA